MHFSRSLFLALALACTAPAFAQLNSPYSRIGLGNIYTPTMGGSMGLAGATGANLLTTEISAQNPATYCYLFKSVLDVGISGRFLTLDDGTETFTSGEGNLSHLAFGFSPDNNFSKHDWGFSTGILPVSTSQYNIEQTTASADTLLGDLMSQYTGTGGLFKYFVGLSYGLEFNKDTLVTLNKKGEADSSRFYRNEFSIGMNYEYLFGSIYNTTIASFPDQVNSVDTKYQRQTSMQGGGIRAGITYQRRVGRVNNLNAGASFAPGLDLRGTQSVSWFNINQFGTIQQITDTLYYAPDVAGTITTAPELNIGLAFNNYRQRSIDSVKFHVTAEFSYQDWSKYAGFLYSDSLASMYRIKVGAEVIPPRRDEVGKSLIPIIYRAGFYYGTSYLVIDGQQLTEFGMTFGTGIPMRGSRVNLAVGFSQRGAAGLIRENYVNLQAGFNISDYNWFIKRKQN